MTYNIEMVGSCTTFITRNVQVEAETEEDAIDLLNGKGYESFKYSEHFEIDDDYSEIQNCTKVKS